MKVILGLGNPGRRYEKTRHNVGWMVLDHLAAAWRFDTWRRDGEALAADLRRGDGRVRLVKPQTWMNLSGQALRPYLRRATWSPATDLLVIIDDAALPLGTIRLRPSGSAGGHNGLRSVEAEVGGTEYPRLRLGIRPLDPRRDVGDLAGFVLDSFGAAERALIDELLPTCTALVDTWIREGVAPAMNRFNRRSTPIPPADDDPPGRG